MVTHFTLYLASGMTRQHAVMVTHFTLYQAATRVAEQGQALGCSAFAARSKLQGKRT